MSNTSLSELLSLITTNGIVTEQHVSDFRRVYFKDGNISVQEADALFKINELEQKAPNWDDLFIEAITAFLVYQTMPLGYINEANAAWLMARIEKDGVVETETELELLLRVMKIAKNVTPALERFALDQVKHKVSAGKDGIDDADVATLRRVLYACSSDGGISITKNEAEALFDLNDVCKGRNNHADWQNLFVGAIANHLMMVAAWNEPDIKEALRREKWLAAPTKGLVLPSFAGLLNSGLSLFVGSPPVLSHMNTENVSNAERVDEKEASWLIERLNRDGQLDQNEKALLEFLKRECPEIHGSLTPLLKAA